MKIRFLGQSGYELVSGSTKIIIDPYLSDSVNRIAGRPRLLPVPIEPEEICCDAVICTHDHPDHLDPDTVARIRKKQLFLTTTQGKAHLEQLEHTNVKALEVGQSVLVGDFRLTAVFAYHTTEAFGLIVEAEKKVFYFSGDTQFHEKLFEIEKYHPYITFICMNGKLGNMNVEEALTVAKRIGAVINIPNHYDMFATNSCDPHLFADCIPGGRVLEFDKEYTFKNGAIMGEWPDVLELFEKKKDYVEKRVREGVEKYRKGDAKITVVDRDGKPVPGAAVKICQKSHAFRFGINLFLLDELETPEKNELYKKQVAEVFNMATLPFYWDANEPEKGKTRYGKDSPRIYRRPPIDLCMEFCEEHGIEPREHGLAYHAFFPTWLYDATVEEAKEELERRFREIAERYGDKIRTIEVTNEMTWKKGKTAFYEEPDFIEWCFRTARKYFPNNQLVINENTDLSWTDTCRVTDKYYSYAEANILRGAPIDAIGMQAHFCEKKEQEFELTRVLLDPEMLYRHMDLYSRLGKPLQVTEVTFPSYSWEPEDEALQAKMLENVYSVWFSHPNVEQIVYWNMVDGYTHVWRQDPEMIAKTQGDMTHGENYYHGGLLRFDMSPKPAFLKLKELIQKTWHTELEKYADETGEADFRGFYGTYEITVCADGKTVTQRLELSKNQENHLKITV